MIIDKLKYGFDDENSILYFSNLLKKENTGVSKEFILKEDIENIVAQCVKVEEWKSEFANILLKNMNNLDFSSFLDDPEFDIKEMPLKKKIEPGDIGGLNVVSVDGSMVVKKLMGVDFSFLKAICVKYHFYKNHLSKIEYYPDVNGYNNYLVQVNHLNQEEITVDLSTSMDMKFMEINLVNKMIEKQSDIDLIIIDGSISLLPINLVFGKNKEITQKYNELLREYKNLYHNCRERGIYLIGSIKDTRSSALIHSIKRGIQMLKPNNSKLQDFISLNYRFIMNYFSDLDLFKRILNKGERSCIFNCKREIKMIRENGIKKEISSYFPLNFYAFYLKTTLYDAPCRIEFFTDEEESIFETMSQADLISSIILPIAGYNEHYGLPVPQIEAHKRAVFRSQEIDLIFKSIIRNLNNQGIYLLEKRRSRRPF
ncbi:MAG: DNA double-strand break repair nuclease NurA [Promethearchaeota archaeon]